MIIARAFSKCLKKPIGILSAALPIKANSTSCHYIFIKASCTFFANVLQPQLNNMYLGIEHMYL